MEIKKKLFYNNILFHIIVPLILKINFSFTAIHLIKDTTFPGSSAYSLRDLGVHTNGKNIYLLCAN